VNWLQNLIIITISFLLARVIIDANIHQNLVTRLISKSRSDMASLVTAILFVSYALSLFFPNTIVVLSMIPVIKYIINHIQDEEIKRKFSTNLILALIYGANIGGMGSLIGSPANIMYLSFIEINKVPGKEDITFFSWLLLGIPATLVLVIISRLLLKLTEKKGFEIRVKPQPESNADSSKPRKYITFFVANMTLIIGLTALQFLFKPEKLIWGFNIIDLLLLLYLFLFLIFSFIFPRGERSPRQFIKNAVFLFLFLLLFPLIFINETLKEFSIRVGIQKKDGNGFLDCFVSRTLNRFWNFLFKENLDDPKRQNTRVFVSINRLIYDLPFIGLVFMGAVITFIYLLLKLGDNPATPKLDGYVFQFLNQISSQTIPYITNLFVFLSVVVLISIFVTEIISNTTVVLILFPIVMQICNSMGINPLFLLMAVSIASTGAFMTPVATSVNAIAYASIPGVSLKKMLRMGFFLNLISGLLITILFHFLNKPNL